jgi:hypothetical protein
MNIVQLQLNLWQQLAEAQTPAGQKLATAADAIVEMAGAYLRVVGGINLSLMNEGK